MPGNPASPPRPASMAKMNTQGPKPMSIPNDHSPKISSGGESSTATPAPVSSPKTVIKIVDQQATPAQAHVGIIESKVVSPVGNTSSTAALATTIEIKTSVPPPIPARSANRAPSSTIDSSSAGTHGPSNTQDKSSTKRGRNRIPSSSRATIKSVSTSGPVATGTVDAKQGSEDMRGLTKAAGIDGASAASAKSGSGNVKVGDNAIRNAEAKVQKQVVHGEGQKEVQFVTTDKSKSIIVTEVKDKTLDQPVSMQATSLSDDPKQQAASSERKPPAPAATAETSKSLPLSTSTSIPAKRTKGNRNRNRSISASAPGLAKSPSAATASKTTTAAPANPTPTASDRPTEKLDWASEMDKADRQNSVEVDQVKVNVLKAEQGTQREESESSEGKAAQVTGIKGNGKQQAKKSGPPPKFQQTPPLLTLPVLDTPSQADTAHALASSSTTSRAQVHAATPKSLARATLAGSPNTPGNNTLDDITSKLARVTINTGSEAGSPNPPVKLHGLTAALSPTKASGIQPHDEAPPGEQTSALSTTSTKVASKWTASRTDTRRTSSASASGSDSMDHSNEIKSQGDSTKRKSGFTNKHRVPLTRCIFDPPVAASTFAKAASAESASASKVIDLTVMMATDPLTESKGSANRSDSSSSTVAKVLPSATAEPQSVKASADDISSPRSPIKDKATDSEDRSILQSPFTKSSRVAKSPQASFVDLPVHAATEAINSQDASIHEADKAPKHDRFITNENTPDLAQSGFESPNTPSSTIASPSNSIRGLSPFTPAFVPRQQVENGKSQPYYGNSTPSPGWNRSPNFVMGFGRNDNGSSQVGGSSVRSNRPRGGAYPGPNRGRMRFKSAPVGNPLATNMARRPANLPSVDPIASSPQAAPTKDVSCVPISNLPTDPLPDIAIIAVRISDQILATIPAALPPQHNTRRKLSIGRRVAGLPTIVQEPGENDSTHSASPVVSTASGLALESETQTSKEPATTATDPLDEVSDCDASNISDASGSSGKSQEAASDGHQVRQLTGLPPSVRGGNRGRFQGRVLFGPAHVDMMLDGESAVITKLNDEEYEKLKKEVRDQKEPNETPQEPLPAARLEDIEMPCSSCETQRVALAMTRCLPCECVVCALCLNAMLNITCSIDGGNPGTSKCPACQKEVQDIQPNLLDDTEVRQVIQKIPVISASVLLPATNSANADGIIEVKSAPDVENESETVPLRFDNCAWDVTPESVMAFLPPNTLPVRHMQPVHILIDRVDGKAKDYLFVEVRSRKAAQIVLQQKQNAVLGKGSRARPVTISLSNHHALIDELRPTHPKELTSLLALCQASLDPTPVALELPGFVVPPATPSRNRDRLEVLATEGAAVPNSPGSPNQVASRYLKSRYAPLWAALSIMSKIKPGGTSAIFWDSFAMATGIISALAKAILAQPYDPLSALQANCPLSPPPNDISLPQARQNDLGSVTTSSLGTSRLQPPSLTTASLDATHAGHDSIPSAAIGGLGQAVARPEELSLQAKISAKIKIDLEKRHQKQASCSGAASFLGIPTSQQRSIQERSNHEGAGSESPTNVSRGSPRSEQVIATPSKAKVNATITSQTSPSTSITFGTPKRDRQKSIRIERERQRTDREKDWKAEDEYMFHRFASVFETVFGVRVAQ